MKFGSRHAVTTVVEPFPVRPVSFQPRRFLSVFRLMFRFTITLLALTAAVTGRRLQAAAPPPSTGTSNPSRPCATKHQNHQRLHTMPCLQEDIQLTYIKPGFRVQLLNNDIFLVVTVRFRFECRFRFWRLKVLALPYLNASVQLT